MGAVTLSGQTSIREIADIRTATGSITWAPNSLVVDQLCRSAVFGLWDQSRPIASFTRQDVCDLVNYWINVRKNNGTTIKNRLKWLRRLFRTCVEDGLINVSPVQMERLPTIPQPAPRRLPFSYGEFQRVLRHVQTLSTMQCDMWSGACMAAYYTGLRVSDVARLRWDPSESDCVVNMEKETIIANPLKRQSVRQRLEIPIEPELYDYLARILPDRRTDSPWVNPMFYWMQTKRRNSDVVIGFRKICDACELPNHSFHGFRHGFVSRLVNAGVHPIIISSMTGQSVAQIQQYSHVSSEARLGALAQARKAMHTASLTDRNFHPVNQI